MILLDANVLIYSINSSTPQYAPSLAVIDAAAKSRVSITLVPQVLMEFLAVTTNARRVVEPIDLPTAWRQIQRFRANFTVLNLEPAALDLLGLLLQSNSRSGQRVYDLFLVAQMQTHGITQICTYNTRDFAGIPSIEALTPEQVLATLA